MTGRVIKRGEIYFVDFDLITDVHERNLMGICSSVGSEQSGVRPALIIQNDVGNRFAPTTIVAPITSILEKKKIPTHIALATGTGHTLSKNSVILLEQVRTVDKRRLRERHGFIDTETMQLVDQAILISTGVK